MHLPTLRELFAARRDAFVGELKEQHDPRVAHDVCVRTLSDVRRTYLDTIEDGMQATLVNQLFQAAQSGIAAMGAVDDVEISMALSPANRIGKPIVRRARGIIQQLALLPAVLCLALAIWLFLDGKIYAMIFSLVIAVVNYFSQRAVRIAPSKVPEVTGHPIVNTDMLVRCMDRMMLDMDQMLNNTSAPELPAPELSRGMMESIQMLMEARINEDGNYALKALPQMMDALQRQGIEVLLFDQDTKQNFDLLPAPDGGETIRPALVKDGHVLCRGQATVKG